MWRANVAWMVCAAGCLADTEPGEPIAAGVVFTYPIDAQRDVPLGTRMLVSYSGPVAADDGGGARLVGPAGDVDIDVSVERDGKTLAITSSELARGTAYELHAGGATVHFTTRNDRPRRGPPQLVAFNGSDPATPGRLRPVLDTSTLTLVFSEPLDPRQVALERDVLELVDVATGAAVSASIVAGGIHVAIDPTAPLTAGATYELRVGDQLADLSGEPSTPSRVTFVPLDGTGTGSIPQVFRARSGAMEVRHPLIGEAVAVVQPGVLASELGDPRALDGPIAFRIPRGQRLASSGLEVALAGVIPSGLATGDIWIELLTDGGGRIYRNAFRPPEMLPDNERSPLLVDLSFDLAVYATDATGHAVLAQSVLGVQLAGVAIADDGVLAIETHGALDIDLLGAGTAATNISLELASDPGAVVAADNVAPVLVGTLPAAGSRDWAIDDGIELRFDEPIDLARARAGGIRVRELGGADVPASIEGYGALVVVRPRSPLAAGRNYRVELADIADVAGNAMAADDVDAGTQAMTTTDIPPSVVAVHPGAPCALVDGGRCAGGAAGDDRYKPFALAADERIAVVFDQPLRPFSLALGTACTQGSVRVERVDASGACLGTVVGSLLVRGRELSFVPDDDWVAGEHYQLRLVSGGNATCEAGEICGANARAASFDRLAGTTASAGGGPDLVMRFVGAAPASATTLLVSTSPAADLNGSGRVDAGEPRPQDNRVALRIVGTSGLLDNASFRGGDCVAETPEIEACMYVLGAIPAQLGAHRERCALPDGTTAPTCIPVTMSAQAMYSTSVTMVAGALGIGLTTETGMSIMRLRERADGPLEGYIVDESGVPTMIVALDLYMDAPDMSLPLVQHDLRSKPLSVTLRGPLTFGDDGRIAINLRNVADVPISVGIDAPLGLQGAVNLIVPAGGMRLSLMTRARRGGRP